MTLKIFPHLSLLAPVERLGDRAHVLFQDHVVTLDRSGQVQDRVLDVGSWLSSHKIGGNLVDDDAVADKKLEFGGRWRHLGIVLEPVGKSRIIGLF